MVIAALIVLLFLLGFGFMIYSHAHREIHPLNRKIGTFISVFIIFFTSIMVVYLGGYLFIKGVVKGEDPFQVGFLTKGIEQERERSASLEKSLLDLNSMLQKQAMDQAAAKSTELEDELKATKAEIVSLQKSINEQNKPPKKAIKSAVNYYPKKRVATVARRSRTSQSGIIKDLTNYDPDNYSPENEPMLNIPVEKD